MHPAFAPRTRPSSQVVWGWWDYSGFGWFVRAFEAFVCKDDLGAEALKSREVLWYHPNRSVQEHCFYERIWKMRGNN